MNTMTNPAAAPMSLPTPTLQTLDRVERIFWAGCTARNPVLYFAKACAKVGYLAQRTSGAGVLYYLASALNEQKHGYLAERLGHGTAASKHYADRDRDLRMLKRAVAPAATAP
ncbi:MAG: hypothetical protein V4593_08180 [Pseudomonadota bacterium]